MFEKRVKMKRITNWIKSFPWKLNEISANLCGLVTIGLKKDESKQTEKNERENLDICMSKLCKDVLLNPEKYGSNTPPFNLQYWAKNLTCIEVPQQIKSENWSEWLTKEQKEYLKHIDELLKIHNEFVKQAKSEQSYFGVKHPKEIYDQYMPKLRQLTSEYKEKL